MTDELNEALKVMAKTIINYINSLQALHDAKIEEFEKDCKPIFFSYKEKLDKIQKTKS